MSNDRKEISGGALKMTTQTQDDTKPCRISIYSSRSLSTTNITNISCGNLVESVSTSQLLSITNIANIS